jgi:hypothetical protein
MIYTVGAPSPEEVIRNNAELRRSNREAFRLLLPFALLVIVFLLLLFRFVNTPGSGKGAGLECAESERVYEVRKGDSCWAIAQKFCDGSLEVFKSLNKGVDCDDLRFGKEVCVPK